MLIYQDKERIRCWISDPKGNTLIIGADESLLPLISRYYLKVSK